MRLRLALLLAALAVAATVTSLAVAATGRHARSASRPAPLAQTRATHGSLIIGLADGAAGWGGASTGPRLSYIHGKTNARWLRDQFNWSQIEPRRGRYSFAYYDHYMLALAQHGMHVIPQLIGTPRWAGPSADEVPARTSDFAGFVATLLRRYGAGGSFWRSHPEVKSSPITAFELWNEPYFTNGNAGHYDPGSYARLVRATSIAAKKVDPSVKLLMEADMVSHKYKNYVWWVDSLYQSVPNLNRYFDGVAVHDFGHDVTGLSPIVPGKPYANFGRVRRMIDLRAQFLRHHAANKPFWVMEFGWPTCSFQNIDCVTEAQQEANLRTVIGYYTGPWRNWIQAALFYRFTDGTTQSDVYDDFGLLHLNGTPKPVLTLFRSLTAHPLR